MANMTQKEIMAYQPKMLALFAESNEYPTQKGVAIKSLISKRVKLEKSIAMMQKIVEQSRCFIALDKNVSQLVVEGATAEILDSCLRVLGVMYGYKPTETLCFMDGSKIAYISKQTAKEQLLA